MYPGLHVFIHIHFCNRYMYALLVGIFRDMTSVQKYDRKDNDHVLYTDEPQH